MIALDTNLLIYAHRKGTPEHTAAIESLEGAFNDSRGWGIPFACLAEYWSIVTHPAARGGPSTAEEARLFIEYLLEDGRGRLWYPGEGFGIRLLQMAEELRVVGPRIFDLQIALTAREQGATELWTQDQQFVKLPGLRVKHPF